MQTTVRIAEPSGDADQPRALASGLTGSDLIFTTVLQSIAGCVLAITGGIGLFLAIKAVPTFHHYGLGFFTETKWEPESDTLGIGSVLVGTFTVAA
ncbi:MAG: phosphate transporter permease, partial [Nocardioidaceae bacterium]|nr:phosphate transporter permease [Nocardioidaceae bacterium]